MAIENESNQMVLFLNLSDLLLRVEKIEKVSHSQPDSSKSEGLVILFRNRMDSVLYIREEGNQKRKKMSSSFIT